MPKSHEQWMQEALCQAKLGEGLTRPNPPVGAVLVKNGRCIGKGFHAKAGKPHAERMAIADAGLKAKGASLYVTLEPCSTIGKTPPCVEGIIEARIKEVVVGSLDPNPKHAGQGFVVLRKQGIKVVTGVLERETDNLLAPFAKHIQHKRPFVTLKMGMTLDGRIADHKGKSQWITGVASRERVQQLRRTADAIMIGRHTALNDNPSLIPRPAHGRKPYRVVLDSQGNLPLSLKLFNDAHCSRTLLVVNSIDSAKQHKLEKRGVQIIKVPLKSKRLSLPAVFKALAARNIMHVLCEGGGQLAGELVKRQLCDRILLFVAPSFLGYNGAPVLGGASWNMKNLSVGKMARVETLGSDLLIEYETGAN